jgi:hypothetical protein
VLPVSRSRGQLVEFGPASRFFPEGACDARHSHCSRICGHGCLSGNRCSHAPARNRRLIVRRSVPRPPSSGRMRPYLSTFPLSLKCGVGFFVRCAAGFTPKCLCYCNQGITPRPFVSHSLRPLSPLLLLQHSPNRPLARPCVSEPGTRGSTVHVRSPAWRPVCGRYHDSHRHGPHSPRPLSEGRAARYLNAYPPPKAHFRLVPPDRRPPKTVPIPSDPYHTFVDPGRLASYR